MIFYLLNILLSIFVYFFVISNTQKVNFSLSQIRVLRGFAIGLVVFPPRRTRKAAVPVSRQSLSYTFFSQATTLSMFAFILEQMIPYISNLP